MIWEYLTVFALAATPLLELIVVIPLGIGYGLDPLGVAVVTLLGNGLPILGIVLLFDRWRAWRARRGDAVGAATEAGRWARARRLWDRYGIPGLALLAPLVTGVHLATVAALTLGSPRRLVLGWMSASILVWTVGVTFAVLGGLEAVRAFL
jgi:Ca2+/H+ antiporter, TMEM165/GDT1 family